MASNSTFKTPGRMETLDRLSNEILLEIVAWLETPDWQPPDNMNEWRRQGCCRARLTYDWKNEEHPRLQSLRFPDTRRWHIEIHVSSCGRVFVADKGCVFGRHCIHEGPPGIE